MAAPPGPSAAVAELSASAWALSSLAAAVESGLLERLDEPRDAAWLAEATGVPAALVGRLLDVLADLGLVTREADRYAAGDGLPTGGPSLELLRADLRTTLLQTHDLFAVARRGELSLDGWRYTDEDVLQAQGTMSAGAVEFLERRLFPSTPGILERLGSESAAFLDVGAGVAAVTIELCRRFPAVRAVGLEPQEAPLALARRNVAAAGLADRIELRRQVVQELTDEEAFDVAWLPGNFLPAAIFGAALDAVHRALRPGGLVLMATLGGGGGDDVRHSAARLRASLWGGDALEPERIAAMLDAAGFVDVRVLDRLPSMLQPIHARRAPAHTGAEVEPA
jgi:SAM-dependent methyltransferase